MPCPKPRLWMIFAVQMLCLSGALAGIIAAFVQTTDASVQKAVDESVHNNLGQIEATMQKYMSPVEAVVRRSYEYATSYGFECRHIQNTSRTSDFDRTRFMTDMVLALRSNPQAAYIYHTQRSEATGNWLHCYAFPYTTTSPPTYYVALLNDSLQVTTHACRRRPCVMAGETFISSESLDLNEEEYIQLIRSVDGRAHFGTGTWITPSLYYEPILNATLALATFVVPYAFNATDGTTTGAVNMDVSLSWFRATLERQRHTNETFISVIDVPSARLLATTHTDLPALNAPVTAGAAKSRMWQLHEIPVAAVRETLTDSARRLQVSVGAPRGANGESRTTVRRESASGGSDKTTVAGGVVVSARFIRVDTLEWLAVAVTPEAYYFGHSAAIMRQMIVVAACVSVLVLAISVLVWVGVVIPLRRMADYMVRAAQLEFDDTNASIASFPVGVAIADTSAASSPCADAPRPAPCGKKRSKGRTSPALAELDGMHSAFLDMSRAIKSFTQYVPLEVVRGLIRSGERCDVRMEPARCTILFADIVGFTAICERIDVGTLAALTRLYFDRMSLIVVDNGGTIDKFIGDCIMAIWGAPVPTADANLLGACCALRLTQEVREEPLQSRFEAAGCELSVRVGVHCGDVLAGNMGCSQRLSYTVIGDAVNTAARMEGLNRYFGSYAMISANVAQDAAPYFVLRRLPRVAVLGKQDTLKVFEVVGVCPRFFGLCASSSGDVDAQRGDDSEDPHQTAISVCRSYTASHVPSEDDTPPPRGGAVDMPRGAQYHHHSLSPGEYSATMVDVPSVGMVPLADILRDLCAPEHRRLRPWQRAFAAAYSRAVRRWEQGDTSSALEAVGAMERRFLPDCCSSEGSAERTADGEAYSPTEVLEAAASGEGPTRAWERRGIRQGLDHLRTLCNAPLPTGSHLPAHHDDERDEASDKEMDEHSTEDCDDPRPRPVYLEASGLDLHEAEEVTEDDEEGTDDDASPPATEGSLRPLPTGVAGGGEQEGLDHPCTPVTSPATPATPASQQSPLKRVSLPPPTMPHRASADGPTTIATLPLAVHSRFGSSQRLRVFTPNTK